MYLTGLSLNIGGMLGLPLGTSSNQAKEVTDGVAAGKLDDGYLLS